MRRSSAQRSEKAAVLWPGFRGIFIRDMVVFLCGESRIVGSVDRVAAATGSAGVEVGSSDLGDRAALTHAAPVGRLVYGAASRCHYEVAKHEPGIDAGLSGHWCIVSAHLVSRVHVSSYPLEARGGFTTELSALLWVAVIQGG